MVCMGRRDAAGARDISRSLWWWELVVTGWSWLWSMAREGFRACLSVAMQVYLRMEHKPDHAMS